LTLGGGINYFGNKYGFTMDTVAAFEIVLSTGKVVTASATSHPDLFWALKGGLNNFGG
jgi:FAD/FMN-containing dehydrogenase